MVLVRRRGIGLYWVYGYEVRYMVGFNYNVEEHVKINEKLFFIVLFL
jgi:hypothetical protein